MLKARIGSAVVALPLLVGGLIYLPRIWIAGLFLVFVCLSVYETLLMIYPRLMAFVDESGKKDPNFKSTRGFKWHLAANLLIAILIYINCSSTYQAGEGRGIIVGGLLACLFTGAFSSKNADRCGVKILSSLLSLVYGVLPWISIWDLYLMGSHAKYLFLLLAIVWAGDTGAYFGGRFFGKHKLSPSKSPKKTWEGSFFGILSSVGAAWLMKFGYGDAMISGTWLTLSAVICGIIGQMGDLVESTLKRFCGVKDSGGLIPGHGGILDRSDGLLFAGPALWFILYSILS